MEASWSGHAHGSSGYRRMILALFAAGLATFSQLYSIQGVLPELAIDQGVSESDAALAVSMATLGLTCSVVPWSMVADRIGRRGAMRAAIVAAIVLGLAVPFAPEFSALLGLRFIEGLALGGIPAIALAYLADEVEPVAAAIASGTYISGTTLGGLLGRVIAGPLSEAVNWRVGTFVVAAVAAIAGTLFFLLAPKPQGFTPAGRGHSATMVRHLQRAIADPRLLALAAQGMLLMGGFVAVYNYLGFHLQAPPFFIPAAVSSLLFLAYLSGTFSSAASGKIVAKVGRLPVLLGCIGVMVAGLALTAIVWLPAIVAGLLVFTAGFFAAHATASGWVPAIAVEGRAQASSVYNLGYYAGSSLFGWLIGVAFTGLGWWSVVTAVAALAITAAVVALMLLRQAPGARAVELPS